MGRIYEKLRVGKKDSSYLSELKRKILIGVTVICLFSPMYSYVVSVPIGYETDGVVEESSVFNEDLEIKIAPDKEGEKEKQITSLLPKTGSQITNNLIVIGILLIFSLFIRKKKDKNGKIKK
ncbi:TPA: LPXTG cell wall anchor domain-containing protein [Enterococcus faecium]